MIKAVREAKRYSSWINPNQDYEQAVSAFITHVFDSSRFVQDFIAFEQGIRPAGLYNALAQTLLLLTAPGVPDIFQGNELWQFTLVDPDNRQPVDFRLHQQLLEKLQRQIASKDREKLLTSLLKHMENGLIKLYVTMQTLRFRNHFAALFRAGDYQKITVHGTQAEHLLAFARSDSEHFVVIVVPRLNASLCTKQYPDLWQDGGLNCRIMHPLSFRIYSVSVSYAASWTSIRGVFLWPAHLQILR